MSRIKDYLKSCNFIIKLYSYFLSLYFRTLTIISPRLNTKARFRYIFKRKINLENPQTFDEKILKLKLERYATDSLIRQCADKFAVREYLKQTGCEDILIPLIASYDSVDAIEWDKLPNSFAMKWNFGCGFNIICPDKSKLDIGDAIKRMKRWGKDKSCYLDYSELQYKDVKKKIIVEDYLKPETGILPSDYKVYCFNGIAEYILLCVGRDSDGHAKFYFFDKNWELARINNDSINAPLDFYYPKPKCFNKLISCAETLSKPFEFVRADFYVVNDNVYFGELTFTPAGAMDSNRLPATNMLFGKLLNI